MTTPSGQISLNDVNVELGFAGTTTISMNQSDVRTLAGVGGSGTPISMQNLQNKSNRVTASATISSNTSNYTLNTAKAPGYSAGKTDMTLTISPSIYISSSSTGSYAFTVDTSWSPGDTVTVVNNGIIIGRGGDGGRGDSGSSNNAPGAAGGPALYVQRAASINNLNRISGGGGGGGGGAFQFFPGSEETPQAGGGGGGGGIGVSSGGVGGSSGTNPGSGGSLTSAGNGGPSINIGSGYFSGEGGNGGTYGSSGSSGARGNGFSNNSGRPGGAAGAAVVGNSNITWINTGTRNGAIS